MLKHIFLAVIIMSVTPPVPLGGQEVLNNYSIPEWLSSATDHSSPPLTPTRTQPCRQDLQWCSLGSGSPGKSLTGMNRGGEEERRGEFSSVTHTLYVVSGWGGNDSFFPFSAVKCKVLTFLRLKTFVQSKKSNLKCYVGVKKIKIK